MPTTDHRRDFPATKTYPTHVLAKSQEAMASVKSSQKITPFLWFSNNAEEAMKFYTSIFRNSRILGIKHYPMGPLDSPMRGLEGKVLNGVFEIEGQRFMALDGGPLFRPTEALSFYVECETQKEVDHYWDKLTEDGDPEAQRCGWLKDKYGFSWQIVPTALPRLLSDPDATKANRVMQAMLKMKKLDVSALEGAYRS